MLLHLVEDINNPNKREGFGQQGCGSFDSIAFIKRSHLFDTVTKIFYIMVQGILSPSIALCMWNCALSKETGRERKGLVEAWNTSRRMGLSIMQLPFHTCLFWVKFPMGWCLMSMHDWELLCLRKLHFMMVTYYVGASFLICLKIACILCFPEGSKICLSI